MGMGRTGRAAYDHLFHKGYRVVSIDSDPVAVDSNVQDGRNVLFADAEDQILWDNLQMPNVQAVIMAMNDEEAKIISTQKLRAPRLRRLIVSHAMYKDIARRIQEAGADRTYLTMSEAGTGLAEHVAHDLQTRA